MKFNIEEFYYNNLSTSTLAFLKKHQYEIISSDYNIFFMFEKLDTENFILEVLPLLKTNQNKFVIICFLYLLKNNKWIGQEDLNYITIFLQRYSSILSNKKLIKKYIKKISNNELFFLYSIRRIDFLTENELIENLNKTKLSSTIQKKCFNYILKNYKLFLIKFINLYVQIENKDFLIIQNMDIIFKKIQADIRPSIFKDKILLEMEINFF